MVRYYDDASVFEGSVEKVWKLIQAHSDTNVGHIHAAFVDQHSREERPGVFLTNVKVRTPQGLVPSKLRGTVHPPHTQTIEFLEGVFAGSWFTTTYIPEGANRTRAVVVGDFRIPGLDDAAVRKAADDFFELGFSEDNAYLKKMA
ncbi:MAG: hypothetical protein ACYDCK_12590 [Thermoplasmatota archaeon]